MLNNPIAHALAHVTLGPGIRFRNLVMLPLVAREPSRKRPDTSGRTEYLLLDEAIGRGRTEITEVSEQGRVPELRVVNRGAKPVLIVDGEELLGAKQNRIVNLSLLVPGKTTLTMPVSCVEAGRWRARSRAFTAAPRTQYASGRAKRTRSVTQSILACGAYTSDQAAVWSDIAEKAARLESESATSAMEAMFTGHAGAIEGFVEACGPVAGQVGALFLVGGAIASLDLFDDEGTLRKTLPKLVRSCAIDAIDGAMTAEGGEATSEYERETASLFLQAVAAAPQHTTAALGMGQDVRLGAPGLTGAALLLDGHAVHVSAFAD